MKQTLFLSVFFSLLVVSLLSLTSITLSASGQTFVDSTSVEVAFQSPMELQCTRILKDKDLPNSDQTHEIVKLPGSRGLFLVSQQTTGNILKIRTRNNDIVEYASFTIGGASSGLHGLALSQRYPGKVWVTLEFLNMIVLVDPHVESLNTAPTVLKAISLPAPGAGPHYVGEYGNYLWTSLKRSDHVLKINFEQPSDYVLFPALPHPIFVARHPDNGFYYASQDASSSILKMNSATGQATQLPIPASVGSTPVGLIAGPSGTGVWFVLLGNATRGTGTFGRINSDDSFTFFRLTTAQGKNASLLHLAFDLTPSPVVGSPNLGLWLLASSIVRPESVDMFIRLNFDEPWNNVLSEETVALPTQNSKTHRILPFGNAIYATQLATSKLTVLHLRSGCLW